jgi:hypothetical protein
MTFLAIFFSSIDQWSWKTNVLTNPAFDLDFFSEHKNGDKRFSKFCREGSSAVESRGEWNWSCEDSLENEQGERAGTLQQLKSIM